MAFPSAGGTRFLLENAWSNALSTAAVVKTHAKALKAKSLAGLTPSTDIMDMVALLKDAKATFVQVAAVPGIAAYAQVKMDDPAFNIVTEFNAMTAQIDATRTWIVNNFPKSSGYLLERSFDANGALVDRTFDTASLATFRTVLDALLATID